MRRGPVPGSRTAPNCEKGLSAGREERKKARLQRLVETLPRIKFDVAGNGTFTATKPDDHEAIRLASQRRGWMLTRHEGSETYSVVCLVKAKAYRERQHNSACIESVGRLDFHGATAEFEHNCDEDLVHGLELLAKRNGWTVEHKGMKSVVTRSPRKAA